MRMGHRLSLCSQLRRQSQIGGLHAPSLCHVETSCQPTPTDVEAADLPWSRGWGACFWRHCGGRLVGQRCHRWNSYHDRLCGQKSWCGQRMGLRWWSRSVAHGGGAPGGTSDWQTGCQRSHNEGSDRVSLLRGKERDRETEGKRQRKQCIINLIIRLTGYQNLFIGAGNVDPRVM